MASSQYQTAFEKFLNGVANPVRWLGFVTGCTGVLPLLISLFFSSSMLKLIFGGMVGGGFGLFVLGTLICTAVRSGLLHGWASTLELRALMRREDKVNKLILQYRDNLEMRKAHEDLLRELGATSETLNRIQETSAELERLRAQREKIVQG